MRHAAIVDSAAGAPGPACTGDGDAGAHLLTTSGFPFSTR